MLDELIKLLENDRYPDVDGSVKKVGGEVLDTAFIEGGRWQNYQVYYVDLGGEYYSLTQEVPATEYQEDGTVNIQIDEVSPVEYTAIKWNTVTPADGGFSHLIEKY